MPTTMDADHGQITVRPNLVAREALLLWPRRVAVSAATVQEADLWPVFAVVLGEREPDEDPGVLPLYELLERPEHLDRISVVQARCHWTIIDPRHALLELSVRAKAPVRFDVDIILPARSVLNALDLLARGGTVAITTQRHSGTLTPRTDIRDALTKLVLISCPPSAELEAVAAAVNEAVC
ncbi:hypothetical protein KIPE111705_26800 [Kibdelosporangium persicum]|uniref:DUF5753 domain-containing protein n=1 Tax=Kibdelosporangium persicum TaxID=2698649 RepID=A0ABX2FGV8_9PSEU|nr:hypothetical protein [Kibdelosporangium persicum]NRN70628.1 hypothetical protein [Kibdelosporangium persicum]